MNTTNIVSNGKRVAYVQQERSGSWTAVIPRAYSMGGFLDADTALSWVAAEIDAIARRVAR